MLAAARAFGGFRVVGEADYLIRVGDVSVVVVEGDAEGLVQIVGEGGASVRRRSVARIVQYINRVAARIGDKDVAVGGNGKVPGLFKSFCKHGDLEARKRPRLEAGRGPALRRIGNNGLCEGRGQLGFLAVCHMHYLPESEGGGDKH
jgi:hypothetical protein